MRARNLGVTTETVPERVLETIARGKALLAASTASLDRSQAAIQRQRERDVRDQHEVSREMAATERAVDTGPRRKRQADPSPPDRSESLRQRVVSAAAKLVDIEEQLADFYEHKAVADPERRDKYLGIAQEAREAARRARIAASQLTPSETDSVE